MKKSIFFFTMLVSVALLTCQNRSEKTSEAPKKPQKLEANHQLDYINLEIDDWEAFSQNINSKVEVPASITYYSENEEVFSSPVGIRLSGIFIKKMPQKSISVEFSKKNFGSSKCRHNIWRERNYDDVDGFVIRAHGNPLKNTFYLDGLANLSVAEHTDLEYSSHNPIILYLNGEYHGLFNLREKKNKDFINNLYDIGKNNIELLEISGGQRDKPNAHWDNLIRFVNSNDLSTTENYTYVSDRIEIDNFIDYHIAETFLANIDWPMANVKVWRNKGGKWRWLFFDCDRAIQNTRFNMLEHITGENQWDAERVDQRLVKSSIIIRKLWENKEFKQRFLIRYQDLMNNTFNAEYLVKLSDKLKNDIEPEALRQINFWKNKSNEHSFNTVKSLDMWHTNIKAQNTFLQKRPAVVYDFLKTSYNLGELQYIQFNIGEGGRLRVNTDTISGKFTGKYFVNLPLDMEVIPDSGHSFSSWTKGPTSSSQLIKQGPGAKKFKEVSVEFK